MLGLGEEKGAEGGVGSCIYWSVLVGMAIGDNPVNFDRNWRDRCRSELRSATGFADKYGWMAQRAALHTPEEKPPMIKQRVKYYGGQHGVTVKYIQYPPSPTQAKESTLSRRFNIADSLLTSPIGSPRTERIGFGDGRPRNPFFRTTSRTYGGIPATESMRKGSGIHARKPIISGFTFIGDGIRQDTYIDLRASLKAAHANQDKQYRI